jgi:hypothetical protein
MDIPNITTSLLTNSAYGYPTRGNARRIKPMLLACIHITSNQNNLGENAATNERNYANRSGSEGPSAHYYLNRDGSVVKAIEPVKYAAWSNGDVNGPNTAFFGYQILKNMYLDNGYNANEAFLLEIENCGYGSSYPITNAQKDTMAYLLATFSISQDIPISRDTVWAHSDVNSVTRPNCPIVKASKEVFLTEVINLAESVKAKLIAQPFIKPYQAQIDILQIQVNQLQADLTIANQRIIDLEAQIVHLQEELDSVNQQLAMSILEKDKLEEDLDAANREIAALKDVVDEYDEVKELWAKLHYTLNN